MRNLKWSDIDIEDELQLMETLLAASLYMDTENETEYDMAFRLIDKVLLRIRDLKKASEVRHA
jgi:hypothetical protein